MATRDLWEVFTGQSGRFVDSPEMQESAQRARAEGAMQNVYGDQLGFGGTLYGRATGTGGPSSAEIQMDRGLQEAQRGALAQAQGARGQNRQRASNQAMLGGLEAAGRVGEATAQLRADEQARAEQAYAQHLAGLQQQNLAQAQMGQADQLAQMNAELERQKANAQISQQNAESESGVLGGLASTAGGALAMFSDMRAKEEISDADEMALGEAIRELSDADGNRAALDDVHGKKFRYTEEAADRMGTDRGERVGVMTQDMKTGPMGAAVFEDEETGLDAIDGRKALGVLLASVAGIDKRLQEAGV